MAEKDCNILRCEENGVEYFTVVATGESGLSEIGLSRLSEIPRRTLGGWLNNLGESKPVKGLETLIGKDFYLGESIAKRGGKVKAIKSDIAFEILEFAAFERGSKIARQILRDCGAIGLTSYIQGKTGWLPTQYQSSKQAHARINRIISKPCPWERMYEPELCNKIQAWYGFDCPKFYWWYCYDFLTPEEKAELETRNPLIKHTSKSGTTRLVRRSRIHQHLSETTRTRLSGFAEYLWRLVELCDSKTEFEKKWSIKYGCPTQLEIFDLWDFC